MSPGKKVLYEQRGAEEYWLVDPDARILTIMRRAQGGFAEPDVYAAGGGRQVSTALLPGFASIETRCSVASRTIRLHARAK